jgi:hypothetical protein
MDGSSAIGDRELARMRNAEVRWGDTQSPVFFVPSGSLATIDFGNQKPMLDIRDVERVWSVIANAQFDSLGEGLNTEVYAAAPELIVGVGSAQVILQNAAWILSYTVPPAGGSNVNLSVVIPDIPARSLQVRFRFAFKAAGAPVDRNLKVKFSAMACPYTRLREDGG